jgi:Fe-S-cluster containining protein
MHAFSYTCNQCGRCCHNQVITLSPYDLIRIARAAGISTGDAIRRYTIRRGSILKFDDHGACVALDGTRCTIHQGRPLACRLYPLGLQRDSTGAESFVRLDPAPGSLGVYGGNGTVDAFLDAQEVREYLDAVGAYRGLLPLIRERIAKLVDFNATEPREFWRVATREALAETNYDPNALIDALYDPDALDCRRDSVEEIVAAHFAALTRFILDESNAATLASAAVMLAISLGYSPAEAFSE